VAPTAAVAASMTLLPDVVASGSPAVRSADSADEAASVRAPEAVSGVESLLLASVAEKRETAAGACAGECTVGSFAPASSCGPLPAAGRRAALIRTCGCWLFGWVPRMVVSEQARARGLTGGRNKTLVGKHQGSLLFAPPRLMHTDKPAPDRRTLHPTLLPSACVCVVWRFSALCLCPVRCCLCRSPSVPPLAQ
jgi:hypothetical protein